MRLQPFCCTIASPRFRAVEINNAPKLCRILVRIQGASRGAYWQKTDQKTSKMYRLFMDRSLRTRKQLIPHSCLSLGSLTIPSLDCQVVMEPTSPFTLLFRKCETPFILIAFQARVVQGPLCGPGFLRPSQRQALLPPLSFPCQAA